MRNVYCKSDDIDTARKCAKLLNSKLIENKLDTKIINKSKTEIICNNYDIKFLTPKQWTELQNIKPGSGYMTIPYDRVLLSLKGVQKEECKLSNLIELVKK